MKIENETSRVSAILLGEQEIKRAILKNPKIIEIGYQKVIQVTKNVEELTRKRNLSRLELEDVAIELKEGVTNHLPTIQQALENLASENYNPSIVAYALSSCCATLNYLQTKYK